MPKHNVLETIELTGRKELTELEAKDLLKEAGINVVETKLATSAEEAVKLSRQLKFPVALKIASPDILHKTDVGGVKLGLANATAVTEAYDSIITAAKLSQPRAEIYGVSVQKMARPGIEVIIGVSQDVHFGPVMMFGLGGVLVEIIKDVAFRIIPLEQRDAREMIREIKGYALLEGYRGQAPVSISKLEKMLLQVSTFVDDNPKISELDLNPVLAYEDSTIAVDARIILK